jgi:hypothetical protein
LCADLDRPLQFSEPDDRVTVLDELRAADVTVAAWRSVLGALGAHNALGTTPRCLARLLRMDDVVALLDGVREHCIQVLAGPAGVAVAEAALAAAVERMVLCPVCLERFCDAAGTGGVASSDGASRAIVRFTPCGCLVCWRCVDDARQTAAEAATAGHARELPAEEVRELRELPELRLLRCPCCGRGSGAEADRADLTVATALTAASVDAFQRQVMMTGGSASGPSGGSAYGPLGGSAYGPSGGSAYGPSGLSRNLQRLAATSLRALHAALASVRERLDKVARAAAVPTVASQYMPGTAALLQDIRRMWQADGGIRRLMHWDVVEGDSQCWSPFATARWLAALPPSVRPAMIRLEQDPAYLATLERLASTLVAADAKSLLLEHERIEGQVQVLAHLLARGTALSVTCEAILAAPPQPGSIPRRHGDPGDEVAQVLRTTVLPAVDRMMTELTEMTVPALGETAGASRHHPWRFVEGVAGLGMFMRVAMGE